MGRRLVAVGAAVALSWAGAIQTGIVDSPELFGGDDTEDVGETPTDDGGPVEVDVEVTERYEDGTLYRVVASGMSTTTIEITCAANGVRTVDAHSPYGSRFTAVPNQPVCADGFLGPSEVGDATRLIVNQ